MDFEKLVTGHKSRSCIISVEKFPDGSYGNILIVDANKAHKDDAESVFHRPFVPNSPYYYYLPQDKNFEDFMYRCACLGEPLHTYVHVEHMGLWVNMFLLPLESDKENIGYCFYACDISPYANTEQQASLAADTATKALEISIKLGRADKENIKDIFNEIMEDIRENSDAEHCSIMLSDNGNEKCINFCEATSPDSSIKPEEIYNKPDFYSIAQSFDTTIAGSSCAIIKDENDIKWLKANNSGLYSILNEYGIKSIVLFPLKHNNITLGYLWVLNFNIDDVVKIKEILELSTYFMASEIANYKMMKQLEFLSTVDMLTGCKNRNAMNNAINDIVSGKVKMPDEYAVIFADLNGLKRVNDEKGHNAGDRLLRTASAILSETFYECEVFRAGGDEFMVIVPNVPEEILKERLTMVNNGLNNDVRFAFGYYYVKDDEDVRSAMRRADERMYLDKEEYYKNHPNEKYR